MPEESGPLAGYNFTDATWRAINGPEPAIVGDVNGSAYALTLPAGSDNALLGSPTQDSVAVIGGFMHRIPAGQTQAVTIPPSSNPTVGRTDIIVARLDLGGFTSPPGPVRLARVAGVEGSAALPTLDEGPPGVEDFPLWAVTRRFGQGLNQAARRWLGRRSGPNLDVPAGEALPTNVPLGTRAVRGGIVYRRQMSSDTTPQPEWNLETKPRTYDDASSFGTSGDGWSTVDLGSKLFREGRWRHFLWETRRYGAAITPTSTGHINNVLVGTLSNPADRPVTPVLLTGIYYALNADYGCSGLLDTQGRHAIVHLNSPNAIPQTAAGGLTLRLYATYLAQGEV